MLVVASVPPAHESQTTLRINEIFFSIQGESTKVGLPTVFIRLTGCPLRCGYCDTAYAFHDGKKMSLEEILQDISQYQAKHVTVTGGEPLAQKACLELLTRLCDEGFHVSLETSGAMDVKEVDERVIKISKRPPQKKKIRTNLITSYTLLQRIKLSLLFVGALITTGPNKSWMNTSSLKNVKYFFLQNMSQLTQLIWPNGYWKIS